MSGVLVDTDVLVWAFRKDGRDPRVRKAKEAIEELARIGNGCVSVQTLAEFARVVTDPERTSPPVAAAKVREAIAQLGSVFDVLRLSESSVSTALHAFEKHRLDLPGSLLWAVAHENGVAEVLTGDLPGRALIEGVRYRDPLS